jgi:citrate lyase subunit beta/citryl-CoA lyase
MFKYPLRSLLFVPGHNRKLLESAIKSKADALLLDIEDSVQPRSNKQMARDLLASMLDAGEFDNKLVFPRVNDRESGELLKDLYQLTVPQISGFMFPKANSGDDIFFYDKLLETIEYDKKYPKGTFKMIALIETSSAVLKVDDICKRSERLIAIAFGCEDYITDLQGIHDKEQESLLVPRSLIAMGARASNIIPIDTVHINVHDLEELEKSILAAKNLGFEGMLCLHPKELDLVHKYYTPTKKEYEDAKSIVSAAKDSFAKGKGVSIVNEQLIGPPIIKNARKIIEKYELLMVD